MSLVRALAYDAYGGIDRLSLRDLPDAQPLPGSVLVRVACAALNPKDALFRKGKFRLLSGRRFPKRCGLDFAGRVVKSLTPDFRDGDLVFGALQEWTFGRGTLAELAAPRPAEVARLPAGAAPGDGAAIALVGLTSLQALRDVARVKPGATVLINGASGGVGTAAIQIARLLGAEVTTISSAATHALCADLGAHETCGYDERDALLATGRFDVVFDVFGNLRFKTARKGLRSRGVFVSTVPSLGRAVLEIVSRLLPQEERLVVVRPTRADLDQLGRWLAAKELRAVIDARHPLADFAAGFARLESKHAHGKIIIDVA